MEDNDCAEMSILYSKILSYLMRKDRRNVRARSASREDVNDHRRQISPDADRDGWPRSDDRADYDRCAAAARADLYRDVVGCILVKIAGDRRNDRDGAMVMAPATRNADRTECRVRRR